ncbi:MAG: hypothetical protein ACE5IR_20185 [bacterium]
MKQMSRLGTGIFIVTLLMLGLSNKWIYGKVPVNFKSLSACLEEYLSADKDGLKTSIASSINSLFIKHDGSGPTAMIILVAYSDELTRPVQELTKSSQTPLVLSISTLPFKEVHFDPMEIVFEQDDRVWHPNPELENDVFPLGSGSQFGGLITHSEIQQGVVLLPETFDVERPITIRYLSSERVLKF